MEELKITIITCTYNSEKFLKETIESVQQQEYKNFEHLFIDGGSTDNTLNIIKSFYSEPKLFIGKDKSLYDAFNKGLSYAQGEIIGFLHSNDKYHDSKALTRIANTFISRNVDYYCAKMIICDKDLKNTFAILGDKPHKPTIKDQLYSSTHFAHPTYYCKKDIIKKVGNFNLKYKIAADIDWLYRLEKITDNFYFDENILVKFRGEGGASANKYFLALKEEFKIRKKREGSSLALYFIYSYHLLRRITRYILEKLQLFKVIGYTRRMMIKLKK